MQPKAIDESKIIQQFSYSHPVFSLDSVVAAKKIENINGSNNTWFAGAYLGNGFHEDGVVSGRQVATLINPTAKLESLFTRNNKATAIVAWGRGRCIVQFTRAG